ncbi:hypothetical protein [Microbulbifer agarilyticus]|nr:hypothetical protein [Microbulbifer agarilyticus]
MKELNALTTGMQGKNNVYVRPGERQISTGNAQYYVFLPGLKATVVRWPNDQFCITKLVMDEHYYQITNNAESNTRLGLYRAKSDGHTNGWKVRHVPDGKVLPQASRIVTISDGHYPTAADAARYSADGVRDFLGADTSSLSVNGCDLHYSPAKKELGGLFCYNALATDDSRGSAVHLANSMEKAQGVKNVRWIADAGGSVVLTQAMQILADKNISLTGHTVYLHKPKTSPAKVVRLAHELDLNVNKKIANTGLSVSGAISKFSVAGVRIKNPDDPYDRSYHASLWLKGAITVSTPLGVAAAIAGGPVSAILGGIATAIGGFGVTYSVGQSVAQGVRRKYRI